MPSSESRYAWRPERKSLPRSLATRIRRIVRSFARSVASAMIPSATANSGAVRASSSPYSPTQKEVAGNAESSAREVVQEAPERARVLGERGQRLEAVDRDDPGPALLDQRADALGHGAQPAVSVTAAPRSS